MTASLPLLIELGTEELPVKALPGLAQAFFDGVIAALDKRGVAVDRGESGLPALRCHHRRTRRPAGR